MNKMHILKFHGVVDDFMIQEDISVDDMLRCLEFCILHKYYSESIPEEDVAFIFKQMLEGYHYMLKDD